MTNPDSLTNKQHEAILYALDGLSWTAIAKKLKITTQTLFLWRKTNPLFSQTLAKYQERVFAETALKSGDYYLEGMRILLSIAKDPNVSPKYRVEAADKMIANLHRNTEAIKTIERNRQYLDYQEKIREEQERELKELEEMEDEE